MKTEWRVVTAALAPKNSGLALFCDGRLANSEISDSSGEENLAILSDCFVFYVSLCNVSCPVNEFTTGTLFVYIQDHFSTSSAH